MQRIERAAIVASTLAELATKINVEHEYHPIANAFPLMEGADFDDMTADVQARGLIDAIILYEGMILEGRNRYRACLAAEVTPRFEQFDGDDPVAFVVSKNMRRRHMSEPQRAMAAARLTTLTDGKYKINGHISAGVQICTADISAADAAERLKVSERSVKTAKAVLQKADDSVIRQVELGHMSVNGAAAAAADLPSASQQRVAASAAEGGTAKAKKTTTEEQENLIARKGCQALRELFGAGGISRTKAAGLAKLPANEQVARVQDEVEKAASKPPPKPPSFRKQLAAAEEEPCGKPILDKVEQPVPEALRDVFLDATFSTSLNALNQINQALKEVAQKPAGRKLRYQQADLQLKDLKRTIKFDAPYAVCTMCKAVGVKPHCACKGSGWLTESSYKALPTEYRL